MTSLHPISPRGYDILRGVVGSPDAAPRKIGKYLLVRELGRGGMSVVHEAQDPELRRRVALKILREDATEPRVIQRLHREAAIGAQLRHPNIVRIFEVGVATDASGSPVHFIAMDYVEGRTLADLMAERRTPRRKLLEIVEAVADAVGYAHEQGVIHRDLKPANVLVDAEGRAALADFGLARAASFATPLTRANAVMGTPQYMAPEQVEGRAEEVDARTDVYALGVLLYEVISGRAPFESETLASLYEKILRADPVHPSTHDRTIDRDLEWICLTAMSRERDRRYADGRAFQKDLRRYLDGQPVQARPPSLLYRVRKQLRRHRAPVAVSLLAAAAIALTLGVVLPLLSKAQASALKQLRSRTDENLSAALTLRRKGNLPEMKRFLANAEKACAEVIEHWPRLAEPHRRLGRMFRALMDDARALECQERALALDPGDAAALYERIVLRTRLHRDAVRAALARHLREWGGDGVPPGPISIQDVVAKDPETKRLRGLVEEDLRRLLAAPPTPDLGDGARLCARGLMAWVRRDEAGARDLLRQSIAFDDTLEEAFEALSDLERDRGDLDAVVRWRTEAIAKDAGYLPHREERGEARITGAMVGRIQGREPADGLKLAIADFDGVLDLEPGRVRSLRGRATARVHLAEIAGLKSPEEGAAMVDGALRDLGDALAKDARDADSWMERSYAGYRRAQIARDYGGDARPFLDQAMVDADQSVQLAPDRDEVWMRRGILEDYRGRYGPGSKTPLEWYRAAEGDLRKAIALNPLRVDSGKALAMTLRDRGLHAWNTKEDPVPTFDEAMKICASALERAPERYDLWLLRGELHYLRGNHLQAGSRDPSGFYEKADADFSKSLLINGAPTDAWTFRALVRRQSGLWLEDAGKDPSGSYRDAVSDYAKAIERSPERAVIWSECGYTRLLLAFSRVKAGGSDAVKRLEEAAADLDRAIKLDASSAATWKHRGKSRLLIADLRGRGGADREPGFRDARADWLRAIELDPALREELRDPMQQVEDWLKTNGRSY